MPYANEQDKIDRHINAYATQSFRDQADRDYIAARMACRAELLPQFLWSAQQAVEKYLKGILLYNRVPVPKRLGHDIEAALRLVDQLPKTPFAFSLGARSREFIAHLATHGMNRYIERPYNVDGLILVDLDLTVWELRRYCQLLNVFGKVLPAAEQKALTDALAKLAQSQTEPRYKYKLLNGFLEAVMEKPKHPARQALLWNNAAFAGRKRAYVKARDFMDGGAPVLHLYPEMLDELLKYVWMPDKLAQAYRDHLAHITANPGDRP